MSDTPAGQLTSPSPLLDEARDKAVEHLVARLPKNTPAVPCLNTSSLPSKQTQSLEHPRKGVLIPTHEEENGLVDLFHQERYSEGAVLARAMTECFPQHGFGWKLLGAFLKQQGRGSEALVPMQKSVQLLPHDQQAQSNLGVVLAELNRLPEAEAAHRRALAIDPQQAKMHSNLGATLKLQGKIAKAEACLRQAIALNPNYAQAHYNLGVLLYDQEFLNEAEVAYTRALALKPDYTEAESNLGSVFLCQSRFQEAESSFRRSLALKPDLEDAFSNLLFLLNYDPDRSAEEIFAAYREYEARFAHPLQSTWQPHPNNRERVRRLKIGYVSPDFYTHSVRYFLEPLLARHDRQGFEIYAYADLTHEDETTIRYQGLVDHWIPTQDLSDESLAEHIRTDAIDILVDLAGHTAHNRLQVFARKPAPVSLSWLGYGYTTGLTAIDYFLTDDTCAPLGSEGLFSETPWRLTTPAYTYRPAAGMGPVGALPACERGTVTFGTLTRAVRINHRTLRVWSEILKRVDGARLVVNSANFKEHAQQEALAARFAAHGIRREQLDIGCNSPPWDVLRGIDIGLDCFPHNSGTTLFETLYMGVPYVTLAGRPSVGRLGSSILEGVGHPEWIARSEEEYIEKAITLAADLPKLAELRARLRPEMETSPLMDEADFAHKVETAYREMFACWIDGQQTQQPEAMVANHTPPPPSPAQILDDAFDKAIAYPSEERLDATPSIHSHSTPPTKHTPSAKRSKRKGAHPSPQEEAALVSFFNKGLYDKGVELARKMTQRFPQHGIAWKFLGALLKQQGRSAEALLAMQKSVQLLPYDQQAQSNLGVVLAELNRLPEAEATHRRALAINPRAAEPHCNLGATLKLQGKIAEAEICLRQAIALNPDYAQAHFNLGVILYDQGCFPEAEAAYRQALVCAPDYVEAHLNLAASLKEQGWLSAAEKICRQILTLKPDYAEAENNLGSVFLSQSCLPEAESSFRRALALKPDFEDAFCNLLFLLNYDPDRSAEEIYVAYREYEARFAHPLQSTWQPHPNNRECARRLKIGYVSPDFRSHAVQHFLEPLLARHDRQAFEIYAYADLTHEDEATIRYQGLVDHWIPTQDLSDESLAEHIRTDAIDILVDLAGHTAHNRLQVFARKPAPVSLSWLGYGYTTGLTAIDYFLTDDTCAPLGSEGLFSETPWRLTTPAYTYRPAAGMGPVGALPAQSHGTITFGTLTRAVRINHRTIRVWSEILKRVDGARLVVNSANFKEHAQQEALAARFAAHGIRSEQLDIGCNSPPWDVLRSIDIGLDCFPHNSGTTLFETLYMGVPFVTLAGRPSVGRLGSSILEGVGHPEWIARSEEEYIEKAVALAVDLPKLAELRARLRPEMEASPLRDEAGFARKVETAYQEMFARWIDGQQNHLPEAMVANRTPPPPSPAQILDDACDKAVTYHRAGQLNAAEQLYRAIVQAQPKHPAANHHLGLLHLQLQQPEAALPYLLAALEANSEEADYWLAYIDALLQAGQNDTAQEVLTLGQQHGLEGKAAEALAARLPKKTQEAPRLQSCAPSNQHVQATKPTRQVARPSQEEENALVTLFNQDNYSEGIKLAKAMTERFPQHGFGWKVLGALLRSQGNCADALEPLEKSAQLEAQDAQAHSNLGLVLGDLGRLSEATACHQRAIGINPHYADAHNNLGNVLKLQGQFQKAEASYRTALTLKPDYAEAYNNLGVTLYEQNRFSEAEVAYRMALSNQPEYAEAYNNLGNTLRKQHRLAEAEVTLRRALEYMPDYAGAHYNLATTLLELHRHDDAIDSFRQALIFKPDFAEAHLNLGITLKQQGRIAEAEACLRQTTALNPDYAKAHYNLGVLLYEQGFLTKAEAAYARALALKPDYPEAESNLGSIFLNQSRLPEAENSFRRALALKPDFEDAFCNLLFLLNYDPDRSAEEIFATYREYEARFAHPLQSTWQPHPNRREMARQLKIGYVSPDFRSHSVQHFLEPLLARHDRQAFEIYAYAQLASEDETTIRYQGLVDHWIPTRDLSDESLAERIRADEIDILVDLAGHTAHNRLPVLARKPAPVSLSWLGYGYTTGLSAIDYFLTDDTCAPPGSEGLFSETPWRLPTPGYVYRPTAGMGPVGVLPARERRTVTFGTLTRGIRINHRTIRVWSEILKRVEGSRLAVNSGSYREPAQQEALVARFAAHGIRREQLDIGCTSPPWDVLRDIDIGLDCFPHNSGATLFETLYMGVPYVTLAGRPSVGRLGSSILEGVGHPEWIAHCEEEYIEKAIALASDLPKLAELRARLRPEMEASPLMDEAGFARKVETAYREMFARWINGAQIQAPTTALPDAVRAEPGEVVESPLCKQPHTFSNMSGPVIQQLELAKPTPTSLRNAQPTQQEVNALAALFNEGRHSEGVTLARSMSQRFPLNGFAWKVLGALLSAQGDKAEAQEPMQKSAQLSPNDEQAQTNLGLLLGELNQLSEAEACHRRALAINPQFAPAHQNLGVALKQQGRLAEAEASFQTAIRLKPDYVKAHINLGLTLYEQKRFSEAEAAYFQALIYKPDSAEAYLCLGIGLHHHGRLSEAHMYFHQALALKPDYPEAQLYLGIGLHHHGRLSEAKTLFQQALVLKPDFAEAKNNLGNVLLNEGLLPEAENCFRQALAQAPEFESAFSNLLFLLNYDPDKSGEEIFAAYLEYDERFAHPLYSTWQPHPNSRERARRLRIGYVSPDFCWHSVQYFLEPLLARHDRQAFEIYAYAQLASEDETTIRYQGLVDHWIPTRDLSDESLAERIRADEIDILVDLAGHTRNNRLQVFARKPAPVSLSWLGYAYTTGLSAIDYFLTDDTCAPPGSECLFSETPWRLTTPAYTYRPPAGMGPVGVLPARERRAVTFGTLTRGIRINHRTIRVWSEILKHVEGSRLAVNSGSYREPAQQEALAARFAAHGIRRDQLEIGCNSPPWNVLRGIDIGLDCFPHNSGATLFETLYMGVPYVTLAGRPSVGRLGSSILEGIRHPEWIARSEEEYVEKAIALASDLPKLADLRAGLRQEMEASPLMDEVGFARKVETAYREMWRQWCTQQKEEL